MLPFDRRRIKWIDSVGQTLSSESVVASLRKPVDLEELLTLALPCKGGRLLVQLFDTNTAGLWSKPLWRVLSAAINPIQRTWPDDCSVFIEGMQPATAVPVSTREPDGLL